MKIFISTAAAKGTVRMSAERIKQILLKRKAFAARLAKVKKPTDKTKKRIARNTERIASLTVKLKTALKSGSKAGKKAAATAPANTKAGKTKTAAKKRPDVGAKPAPEKDKEAGGQKTNTKNKSKVNNLNGLSKIAENRVGTARKAYTEAKLNKSTDPKQLEKLKARYQDAFRSYMKVGRKTSQSSAEFDLTSTSALPGRHDPVVLAYNHIMGNAPSVKSIVLEQK